MSLKLNDIEATAQETKLVRRWSRTKLENCTADDTCKNVPSENWDKVVKSDACSDDTAKIDRIFGKTLGALSLRKLLQNPEFSVLDGLNEYDDDFTYFAPRGELITHEMHRVASELGDRIANADTKVGGQVAEFHSTPINGTFVSTKNAESLEDEGSGGKA